MISVWCMKYNGFLHLTSSQRFQISTRFVTFQMVVSLNKNIYNFYNLCQHEQDFAIKAQWSFFATAHGKSPCDGISGTVKRVVSKESLQHVNDNHILDFSQMYNFCNDEDSEYIVKNIFPIAKKKFIKFFVVFLVFFSQYFFFENSLIMLYFSSLTFSGTTQLGMQQNSRSIFVNSYLVIITVVTYLYAIFPFINLLKEVFLQYTYKCLLLSYLYFLLSM